MGLQKKIAAVFLVLTAVVIGVACTAFTTIRSLGKTVEFTMNNAAASGERIHLLTNGFEEMSRHAKSAQQAYSIQSFVRMTDQAQACGACHDQSVATASNQKFQTAANQVRQAITNFEHQQLSPRSAAALSTIDSKLDSWTTQYERFGAIAGSDFDAAHTILVEQILPTLADVERASQELTQEQQKSLVEMGAEIKQQSHRSLAISGGLLALSLICSMGGMFVVCRTTNSLRVIVQDVQVASHHIAVAMDQVSHAADALASGASEQTEAISGAASRAADANGNTSMNLDKVEMTAAAAQEITQSLRETRGALDQLTSAMDGIGSAGSSMASILRTINEIAFQTNLLSLNAAVEAARAGQDGVGFAVIADEVRRLAARTSEAARETTALIEQSQARAGEGRTRLQTVDSFVAAMAGKAEQARTFASEIREVSRDQAAQLDEVANSLAGVQEIASGAAVHAEESATVAADLTKQAQALGDVVARLRSLVGNCT